MGYNVEFDLKLREMVSGVLKNLHSTTRNIFDGIGKIINKTQTNLSNLGKGAKINVDTSGVHSAMRDIDRLHNKMNSIGEMGGHGGMSTGKIAAGAFIGGLATQGAMMAGHKAYELGREGLGIGMEMEKNIVGLSTFVGEKKARSIIDRIVREGVLTPYTTQQLLPVERGLLVNEGAERAHRDTWALANAIAATGGGGFELQRMGWHMQQGAAQGNIDGRIMREFAIAGIPITKLLQNSMPELKGLSQAKAMEKLDGITVKYDMVADALYKASQKGGMFAGAMDKLSQTVSGKWSTVMDKMQIAGWKLTESQSTNIKNLEDRMIGFADALPGMAASMAGDFNKAFARMDELAPSLKSFGSDLFDILKPVKDLALSKELTDFIKSLSGIGNLITKELKDSFRQLGEGAKFGLEGATKELNYYQSGWDFLQRIRPFNRRTDEYGTGLMNVMGNGGTFAKDLSTLSFGLIKPTLGYGADKGTWTKLMTGLNAKTDYSKIDYSALGAARFGAYSKPEKTNAAATAASDAIVGGGRKVININFKNFVENLYNNPSSTGEAVKMNVQHLKTMLDELLAGVPA
jgi:hypothetical protein